MIIIFPSNPGTSNIHPFFESEYNAAISAGHNVCVIPEHRLRDISNDYFIRTNVWGPAIYRGFQLDSSKYSALYGICENNNLTLINNLDEYCVAHYLSNSYAYIYPSTIDTFFVYDQRPLYHKQLFESESQRMRCEKFFLKDFVKSEENNVIENIHNAFETRRTIENFISARGDCFDGGLSFRKFINLPNPEYRLWVIYNKICDFDNILNALPLYLIQKIQSLPSNFYSCDITMDENRNWIIIETDDGQVSGLKELESNIFYKNLKNYDC